MAGVSNSTKKIIDELFEFIPERNKDKIVEQRATHIIVSAINFIKLLNENYSRDEAEDLTRKFLVAIKSQEPRRFSNKLKNINKREQDE
jgi:hypothetical protein